MGKHGKACSKINLCKSLEHKPPCNTKVGERQSPQGHRQAVDPLECSGTSIVEMVPPSGQWHKGGSKAAVCVLL